MVPFAGIAFLWFIGVIRDIVVEMEDKFFATVFLGSCLLFGAMLFASAAVAGRIIASLTTISSQQTAPNSIVFSFGRSLTYVALNISAMKMAGVFIISTCTIGLRTERIPRLLAILGYIFAGLLLLSIAYVELIALLFPFWILMLSIRIIIENYRQGCLSYKP